MAGLLHRLRETTPLQADVGLLVLRLWFGFVLAFGHGMGKVADLQKFTANVAKVGFPLPDLMGPFAAFSEFGGGILLALGLFARPAAAAVAGTMLGAAFVVHWTDAFSKKEFALAYAVTALVVLAAGPGRYSLDAVLAARAAGRDSR